MKISTYPRALSWKVMVIYTVVAVWYKEIRTNDVTEATMARPVIQETPSGLRLVSVPMRTFGTEEFTWADLLYTALAPVRVYTLYFPSRFDTDLDATVMESLRTFGTNTPKTTSVNFWDATDPEFSQALDVFDIESPPALVFVSGLRLAGMRHQGPREAPLYAIAITRRELLGDRERFSDVVNTSHEIVARGNPRELTAHLRRRQLDAVLDAIGELGGTLRDQILKLRPKFLLPGGVSVELG